MSKLRLTGSTSGFTELTAPAVAGSNTLTLPTSNGTADQALITNGSGTLSFANRVQMVQGTAVASTSGTSIDFTGIPSYVKRITVMFDGVSTNGTSIVLIRLGTSSGVEATGYKGTTGDGGTPDLYSTGFSSSPGFPAASIVNGQFVISSFGSNTWAESHLLGRSDSVQIMFGGGIKTLSGTLDRIRITTVNGTDTFDAGTINIMYEG